MLNWILATIALVLWVGPYLWFFRDPLRRLLWRRRNRATLAELEQIRRAQAYAAWMRRPGPPPRARPAQAPVSWGTPPTNIPAPAPRASADIVPFPSSRRPRPRER